MNYDEWEEFPKTYKWSETIKYIKTKNCNIQKIKEIIRILIDEANAVEDKVLTVAILQIAFEDKILDIEEIKDKYGESIADIINFITRAKDENFKDYIFRIFNCSENIFIRKIILSKELYNLRKFKENDNSIYSYTENAKIILKYDGKTHKQLMEKLKKELNMQ